MPHLTMSTLGINGRLGNQLFQYAAMIGIAKKQGFALALPVWSYAKYFDFAFPDQYVPGVKCEEPTFCHSELPDVDWMHDVDLKGFFQSFKYWQNAKEDVRKALSFRTEFKTQVRAQMDPKGVVFAKPTIAISIRRGDYVNNPNYELLPITYYILALFEDFPNWREHNIVIFSDDIPYCKVHFDCIPNVFFSENNSDIEDLCLMSMCDHFILSNSTFSWWGGMLGEKFHSKVVRPCYLFNGKLLQEAGNKLEDFFPENWLPFEHKIVDQQRKKVYNKKIPLGDVTFTIPVSFDHEDRKENLSLCLQNLREQFDTHIILLEQGDKPHFNDWQTLTGPEFGVDYELNAYEGKFHRTKMLNDMAKKAVTDFVFNWDADILIPPFQIYEAVQQLRNGADMVYPYAWAFARIPRTPWFDKIFLLNDIGLVGDTKFNGMNVSDVVSVGGAVGFNRKRFLEGGGENERFISYGAEDVERLIRFEKLGYRIERALGQNLYHMNHYVGANSSARHADFENNEKELEKVKSMTKEQLRKYVDSWSSGVPPCDLPNLFKEKKEFDLDNVMSVVINLDRRKERWAAFEKEAEKSGVGYTRIAAIDAREVKIPMHVFESKHKTFTPGAWALAKTTEQILKDAVASKVCGVLFMEDDIQFEKDALLILQEAMLHLPADWECLLLSQFIGSKPKSIGGNAFWEKTTKSYSNAMYIVRDTLFADYLNFLSHPTMAIDDWLASSVQKRGTCYSLKKSIAWQVTGESDIIIGIRKWEKGKKNENILIS
jgi:GR25 family glycosyltransferase involved in LPS biosynthesis